MTDAVMSDYFEDFYMKDTGQSFSLSIHNKNARTESRTSWTTDLVGRTGREVATELSKEILKFILLYQILSLKSTTVFF